MSVLHTSVYKARCGCCGRIGDNTELATDAAMDGIHHFLAEHVNIADGLYLDEYQRAELVKHICMFRGDWRVLLDTLVDAEKIDIGGKP